MSYENNSLAYLAQQQKILESNGYVPQSYQQEWHNCPTRFLVLVTGRQIGKTTGIINDAIKYAWEHPNTRTWYVTNDYSQAKRNVWDTLKRYITNDMVAKFNESELKATFPNGSKIELIGVENAESLRGAVVHRMYLDEYADFPREIWPKVLRPMLSTTGGNVWFVGTPKGMGNDLYDKFFTDDPDTTKFKIPAITGDTPVSAYADIKEILNARDTLPKDAFDQEYLAEFTRPSGTVYSDWPLENFKEVNYDVNLPVQIALDFGVNDPTSIIWVQPNGSEYRVIDYYEGSDANIDHFISVILAKPYKTPELYVGDPAGKARTLTTGTSPIEIMAQKGIHVRTKDGVKIPDQIRATHGIIKSLFVSNRLTRFRDCLLNYRYPEIKDTARNQENEIPIHDEFCLEENSMIRTLYGWKAIKNLEGKEFYVWGYSEKEKRLVPTKAARCWKTYDSAKILAIGLDDDDELRCTPNHRVMLRDGSYRKAKDLVVGDSLMPFYEWQTGEDKHTIVNLNDGSNGDEHRLVYNRFNGQFIEGHIIHHKDGNKKNNNPDNLEQLTVDEHCKITKPHLGSNSAISTTTGIRKYKKNCIWCGEEYIGTWKSIYCSSRCSNRRRKAIQINEKREQQPLKRCVWCGKEFHAYSRELTCSNKCAQERTKKYNIDYQRNYRAVRKQNHKVTYIRERGYAPVYDIEVPETHNFVANGVVVHNCHAMRALEYYAVNVKDITYAPTYFPPMQGLGGVTLEGLEL